jgi:pimeloyl-ACP methyl ester carboxylesterase
MFCLRDESVADWRSSRNIETMARSLISVAGHEDLGRVRTWYDEHGEREPLALLHPGGEPRRGHGCRTSTALAAHVHVFTPERRGHERTPDVAGPITYELMAEDTVAFLEGVVGGPARLVGCSAGASVALRRPDLARLKPRAAHARRSD